jgi:integrase
LSFQIGSKKGSENYFALLLAPSLPDRCFCGITSNQEVFTVGRPQIYEPTISVSEIKDKSNLVTHLCWRVSFPINGVTSRVQGKVSIKRIAKQSGLSQRSALAKAKEIAWDDAQKAKKDVESIGAKRKAYTLESWSDHFFENVHSKSNDPARSTLMHGALKFHLMPMLGNVKLENLDWQQLESWWADLKVTAKAAPIYNRKKEIIGYRKAIIPNWKTRDHLRQYLVTLLEEALKRTLIRYNPARTIPAEANERDKYLADLQRRKKWFSASELKVLLEKSKDGPCEELMRVQFDLQCRVSEACCVRLDDFDESGAYLLITKQRRRVMEEFGGSTQIREAPTKGDANRFAAISPELAEIVKKRRAENDNLAPEKRCPYIITGERGGPMERNQASRLFRKLCEVIGIDLPRGNSTHAIRRSVVEIGKHTRNVSSATRAFLAGHDKVQTTSIYELFETCTPEQAEEITRISVHIRSEVAAA